MKKNSLVILLILFFSNCFGQTKDSLFLDFGWGEEEKISLDSLESLYKNNVFCISYLYQNELIINSPQILEDKEFNRYNSNFYLTSKHLCLFKDKKEIKRFILSDYANEYNLNLASYHNFYLKNDLFEYFVFYTKNLFGDLNKFYFGLIVKNKKQIITLPDIITSPNPHLFFWLCLI